jgi:hypothetical protein
VENLIRKVQVQEVELERTTKQLKEAIAIAEEETTKCEAAKEVIKSLTAQVRWKFLCISTIIFWVYFDYLIKIYQSCSAWQ